MTEVSRGMIKKGMLSKRTTLNLSNDSWERLNWICSYLECNQKDALEWVVSNFHNGKHLISRESSLCIRKSVVLHSRTMEESTSWKGRDEEISERLYTAESAILQTEEKKRKNRNEIHLILSENRELFETPEALEILKEWIK